MLNGNYSDDDFLELRGRLMVALDVLEEIAPPSFEAAFDLLATYVPGIAPAKDKELAARFRKVVHAINASHATNESKKPQAAQSRLAA